MKTTVRIVLVLLAMLLFSGCGAQEQRYSAQDQSTQGSLGEAQNEAAESDQSGKEPLTYNDADQTSARGNAMYLSMNGETQELELVGLVQSGGIYSVMYWARDVRNNRIASVSLMIPVRGLPGDQFTEKDTYANMPMANIIYTDRNGNTYSTMMGNSQSGYDSYDEFINPTAPEYRAGRQFVIAIDDVSTDGNVISGRLIATFNGRDDDSNDTTVITIDESSFSFDMRDGSKIN